MMFGPYGIRLADLNTNNTQLLREGLGKFATGVTVVTCQGPDGPCGITANSFSSVSLDPPRVLWNIDKASTARQAYLEAEHFAINVLSTEQQLLSAFFARAERGTFDEVEHALSANGVPLLNDVLACFECRTHDVIECGDHFIIIGDVEDFHFSDGEPLLVFNGRYHRLR